MIKKWFLSLSLGSSVLLLAACGDDTAEEMNGETETQKEAATDQEKDNGDQPEMPEPDLAGIPDIIAEVNGEEIGKEEFETAYTAQFQQLAMQAQMSGQEVDQIQLKEQIAESLVAQKLLVQETENQEITASEEQKDTVIQELAQQNGIGSTEEFLAALEEQGISEDEVLDQVETQVKVEQLIAEETGQINPTDEELQTFYEQAQAQQEQAGGDELPAFEELKPELEEQVRRQNEGEATQALVAQLRETADVTIHI